MHGKGLLKLTIVDWHPFTYFTGHAMDGNNKFYQLYELEPLPDNSGAILHWRWKTDMGMPRWLSRIMGATMGRKYGRDFCKMIDKYIETVQKPTFQPEA